MDTLVSVLLFRQRGPEIEVINQVIHLRSEEIKALARHILSNIKSARRISLHAVTAEVNLSRVPALRFSCTEDMVVTLPTSAENYLHRLGTSTRKSIRQNLSRAQRHLPGFAHDSAYDAFGMGTLCCSLMIMASIEAGDRGFHLMDGQFGATQMLLGQRMPQVHLVRYRSRLDLLRHVGGIARLAARSWLAEQPHLRHQTVLSRTVARVLPTLKQVV